MRPWVSDRQAFLPLPRNVFCVGGEGKGEGARPCPVSKPCFEQSRLWEPMKCETRQLATNATPLPASPPESPALGDSGERRTWP